VGEWLVGHPGAPMDNLQIESVAEATAIPLDPRARLRLRVDNFAHRLRQAAQRRIDRLDLAKSPRLLKILSARRVCGASVVSHRPPVFLLPFGGERPLWMVEALGSHFPEERALFLLLIYWSLENPKLVESARLGAELHRSRFPKHALVFLCNTPLEQELLDAAGLVAIAANHNLLVSEHTFRPLGDVAVAYDAVYNARLCRFKRHYLAAGIERVIHIAYCTGEMSPSASRVYMQRILSRSPQHRLANPLVDGLPSWIGAEDVNRIYNQASVGLCLSPVEGAMYASMEYLLAGLPIVTTPSLGGRDAFFDADFCLTVPPEVRAVRDAVVALAERSIPRAVVRGKTLARVESERRRSRLAIENAIERQGLEVDATAIWPPPRGARDVAYAPVRDHIVRWREHGLAKQPRPPARLAITGG